MAYFYRLFCLCLASFFLLHLLSGLAIWLLQGPILRASDRMPARSAARFLFAIRLLPLSFAVLAVALFCIPSYLWFEPHALSEPVGPWCFAAASIGAAICGLPGYRVMRALVRSAVFQRSCRRTALQLDLPGGPETVWVTESASPGLALAGIFRPTLVTSRQALSALSMTNCKPRYFMNTLTARPVTTSNGSCSCLRRIFFRFGPRFRGMSTPGRTSRSGRLMTTSPAPAPNRRCLWPTR